MVKVVDTVAVAWDLVTPTAIRNSWKKLIPLSSSFEQDPPVEISDNEFVQQFSRMNITLTNDEIQSWMRSDGPGYEHMDEQGIVALISRENELDVDEEEEEDEVSLSSQCSISHSEAMSKMNDYLTWYRCQPQATPENVSQLIQFRDFAAERRESSVKQTSILSYFSKSSDGN